MTKTANAVDANEINLDETLKGGTEEVEIKLTPEEESRMREMMAANVFYGHVKSKTNPKMRTNIISTKSGVEVIDLLKSMRALDAALKVIKEKVKMGGNVLFVGTTPSAKFAIKETAMRLGMPYVTERWLGGTLTNYKTISTRVAYFTKLETDKASGKLMQYTKKERSGIDKELERFEKLLRGIQKMDRMPALVFVADLGTNGIAATEARRMKIPSIGLVNTSSDPDDVNYPIPSNDRNSNSVLYIVNAIEKAVLEGKELNRVAEAAKVVASTDKTKINQSS